ncbi:MAG: AAA family ATPase [Myxococcales bacterium]|nr:AAA family ATPase [Myxococcales bacterium]
MPQGPEYGQAEVSGATERGSCAPGLIGARYEVEALVGSGGMATVYRVRDRRDGRALALKRLSRSRQDGDEALRLFEREFHTLAQLSHPRIIEVYDYGLDDDGAFYTMELLSGADLRELSPLPWESVCRYLRELATSLALLHARRLLHRDVSPRNVRLMSDGHCKLIDFGVLADQGCCGEVIGTAPCVPPEALDGQPMDQGLDLYGLGAVGYFMLTGKHAYPVTDPHQLRTAWTRKPAPPSAGKPECDRQGTPLPEIPQKLDALIMALLSLDRRARPASAGAVIDRLDAIGGRSEDPEVSLAESHLVSVPIVGRERELSTVAGILDSIQRGRGHSLLLSADEGMGRTRLLAEIELAAKLRGVLTLAVHGEAHPRPYGTVLALVSRLLTDRPGLARPAAQARAGVLQQLLPELSLSGEARSVAPVGFHSPRWRTACQQALSDFFIEVACAHPIALLVDDVHRCDEASAVLLATLALASRELPLLLVSTVHRDDEAISETALSALAHGSRELRIPPLGQADSKRWLESIFGDAPHLQRLCDYLHERSRGSPAITMELLRLMLDRGDLVYSEGAWTLPNEPSALALPPRATEVFARRLGVLSAEQREIAEQLSVHRGAMTLAQGQALWGAAGDDDLGLQLQGLVQAGLLSVSDEGYRFDSEALRRLVYEGIEADRRARLQLRLAETMLQNPELTHAERLTAGLHLLDASDGRGSALVVDAALDLGRQADDLGSHVRLLERALEALRRRGEPLSRILAVLVPLGLAAYTVDRRLDRHEAALSDALDRVMGLDIARRWQRALGRLGAWLGLGFGLLRYALQPRRARPCGGVELFELAVNSMVALAGKAAACLDRAGIDRIADRLEPLAAFGVRQPAGFAHAFCRALVLTTEDRFDRTYQRMAELETVVDDPKALPGVPAETRSLLKGGVSYTMGLLESCRGDRRALDRADALDAHGIDVHQLIAAQLRLQYHGFRGEVEEVREAYERMETAAIRAGCSWQVEVWAPLAVNLFGALWQDLVIAKRTMTETRHLGRQAPGLERYEVTAEAVYELTRGNAGGCVARLESLFPNEQPLERVGWSADMGILAQAHNELGDHESAKRVCEEVLAVADPRDASYYAVRIAFELPYAIALASLGEYGDAEAYLQKMLERYEEQGGPFVLGAIHETWARVAWMRGDRKCFTEHLKQVEGHFTALGNPALIARFQRLTDTAASEGGFVSQVAIKREVKAFEAALAEVHEIEVGARHVLAWLMRQAEGFGGLLFVRGEHEPRLLASTGEQEPPGAVYSQVDAALRSLDEAVEGTHFGAGAETQTKRGGERTMLFLLAYFEGERLRGEGALVLLGRGRQAPAVRHELLAAAAKQLSRLRAETG